MGIKHAAAKAALVAVVTTILMGFAFGVAVAQWSKVAAEERRRPVVTFGRRPLRFHRRRSTTQPA
jgi:hypothetical protein